MREHNHVQRQGTDRQADIRTERQMDRLKPKYRSFLRFFVFVSGLFFLGGGA